MLKKTQPFTLILQDDIPKHTDFGDTQSRLWYNEQRCHSVQASFTPRLWGPSCLSVPLHPTLPPSSLCIHGKELWQHEQEEINQRLRLTQAMSLQTSAARRQEPSPPCVQQSQAHRASTRPAAAASPSKAQQPTPAHTWHRSGSVLHALTCSGRPCFSLPKTQRWQFSSPWKWEPVACKGRCWQSPAAESQERCLTQVTPDKNEVLWLTQRWTHGFSGKYSGTSQRHPDRGFALKADTTQRPRQVKGCGLVPSLAMWAWAEILQRPWTLIQPWGVSAGGNVYHTTSVPALHCPWHEMTDMLAHKGKKGQIDLLIKERHSLLDRDALSNDGRTCC